MNTRTRGMSLVDVVVGVGLMLVMFLALAGILRASLVLSTIVKAKAAALEIANAQMEYLRGLSYDSIGTVGGIPAGLVPQNASTTVDGIGYNVRTYVQYYDDPADGTGAGDTNSVTTDYKNGKVVVSYTLYGLSRSVILVSNFFPPGIESSTGGGTLSLHVVNAAGANVGDAVVQIVNASTTPAVNLTTFTDSSGLVLLGGAATSSQYQIYVSRSGYSGAQTYARTVQNVNPTPGYLTVSKDLTTSATFAIDLLASLTLSSFASATTTYFNDSFTDTSNLASQSSTQVSGGTLTLFSHPYPTGYDLSGSAHSISITPSLLDGWGILSATLSTPGGTTAVIHVDDISGTPLPDGVLPGNAAGFSSFPVSLTGVSTTTYPGLTLEADLSTNATTTTPAVLNWSLSHTEGPAPSPNIAFTLTGAKTIGTDSGGQLIYKTVINDSTGAGASTTESLEWDGYTLSLPSANLIESCPASPYPITPASASTTALLVGTLLTNTLPLLIQDSDGNLIANALVLLTKSGYAATQYASACGLAYFNGIPAGTYTATVSAPGHTTHVFNNVVVSGHTSPTTLTLP